MAERAGPKVAWVPPPLTPTLPMIPILSPKPGQAVYAISLDDQITGVMTHFVGARTKPCTGDDDTCEGCQLGKPKRWKGYLAGEQPPTGKLVLIELTYEGYRGCPAIHGPEAKLRGRKFTLKRAGQARNSRVLIEVSEAGECNVNRQRFDVQEALTRIWFGERSARNLKKQEQFRSTLNNLVHQVAPPSND